MSTQFSEFNIPKNLEKILKGYNREKVSIGWSKSEIFKFTKTMAPTLFLKINRNFEVSFFNHEFVMLNWLKGKLPVPDVIYQYKEGDQEYLLLSEIPGKVSYEVFSKSDIEVNLGILANGLQKFHTLSTSGCPRKITIEMMMQHAETRLKQGLISNETFDVRWKHKSPEELFNEVKRLKPKTIDEVVTHGDYCLPNVMIKNNELSGFVDLGSVGINDRFYDIAAVIWSISYNFGEKWISVFLENYGITQDETYREKILFYQMLNEFIEF